MSASKETLVEQILELENEIARKAAAGEDISELSQQREELHKKLQETVKKQDDGKSLLKG